MDASGNALIPSDTAILTRRNILAPAPPGPTCVVNAAHYRMEAIAPGEIISILGPSIGPDQPAAFQFDSSGKVPAILANTRVLIGGLPAPLLGDAPGLVQGAVQINARVPRLFHTGEVSLHLSAGPNFPPALNTTISVR